MNHTEETGQQQPCEHFMVWNIQRGYSYYRCDRCTYIDGEKTFFDARALERKEVVDEARARMPAHCDERHMGSTHRPTCTVCAYPAGHNDAVEKVSALLTTLEGKE